MNRAAMAATTIALLSLLGGFAWAEVEVGGVVYDHVDPGEPFTSVDKPSEDWDPPSPTKAEAGAGLIPYWRPAPEELRPWSRPRREECIRQPLRVFAALGETEPLWVALYAREDLARISARLEGLPERVTPELFVVHFWPQRTSWKTREYYVTPELLVPYDAAEGHAWFPGGQVLQRRSYDLAAGTTGAVWLRLNVSRAAASGTYRFRLHLQAERRGRLTVPIELEVLPFELRKPPDRSWLVYGDTYRWRGMSDEQRWLDAKDYAAHGMDGIVELPSGTPDLAQVREGRVKWDINEARRYLELLRQAGMKGPWVMSGGLARQVQQALGISADLNQPWPEEIRRGVQAGARALNEAYEGLGVPWFFYGTDEPSEDNVYAVEQYRNWKAGGAPVYVTICRPGFWTAMAPSLDAPCFASFMVSNAEASQKTREECEGLGKQFWWYGSGCYIGQEGRIFPNRFLAGILFWKTGAWSQVSWTYMRPHEDPFNDFDGEKANQVEPKEQATVYPWLERAGDWSSYRGPIQTIQWEALREGVDDYCYLYTLGDLATRAARASGVERARAGRQAKRALRDIADALPWSSELSDLGFGNRECQSVRRLLAAQIEDLEAGTLGEPGSRLPERLIKIALEMHPAGRATARTLPALAVPRLPAAPVVDGAVDDQVWRQAALVETLRNTQTGDPVTPGTRVWVGYDDRALYVAFACDEPMMDRLVVERSGRDAQEVWLDDGVEVFLDPSGRRERYAHFIVNAAGAMLDAIGEDLSWNSSARAAAQRYQGSWQCELEVPWADLEAAGLKREAVMALNLCRNRMADPAAGWKHAAWSATYAWFHVPARFGVALPEQGDLGLVDVELPTLFGRQMLKVALVNRTQERQMVRVQAAVDYEGQEAAMAPEALLVETKPGERTEASVPVALTRAGKARIVLTYGPPEGKVNTASFDVVVPEPATLPSRLVSMGRDGALRVALELNVAPSGDDLYVASGTYTAAGNTQWRGTLRCTPGQLGTLEGEAEVPAVLGWLDLRLQRGGEEVWQTQVPVMPQFDALASGG